VRVVCCAFGVSSSHVLAKKRRPSEWADGRRSPTRLEDAKFNQAIADVVDKRATYGTRRVLAGFKLEGLNTSITIVFTASCELLAACCICKVKRPWTQESTKAKWASKKAIRGGDQMGWSCLVRTVNASEWSLRLTVATESS
jgi:hypothetical protein